MAVPYERRWMVPTRWWRPSSATGFVWGGKWLFYDTMHFEYRPEVLRSCAEAAAEAAAAAAAAVRGRGPTRERNTAPRGLARADYLNCSG